MKPNIFIKKLFGKIIEISRSIKFDFISNNKPISGKLIKIQPAYTVGVGKLVIGRNVRVGFKKSPGFWSTYCHLECRGKNSIISIGDGTHINNNFSAISTDRSIIIGKKCLIGYDVSIIDSNFHCINPDLRHSGGPVAVGDVEIMDNVFIGSRVIILKDTKIGSGSVVSAGSVVSGVFPPNCIIAGNPATIIRNL